MPAVKLTAKFIKDTTNTTDGDIVVMDADARGLALKITAAGRKSYIFQYRLGGRGHSTQRYKIGNVSDALPLVKAREEATHLLSQVRRGIDPQAEKRLLAQERLKAKTNNFSKLLDEYYEQQLKQNRSGKKTKKIIEREFRALGHLPLREIERADISRVVNGVSSRGSGYSANRLLAFIKTFFRWATGCGYIAVDPTSGMQKPFKDERARDRVLTPQEIAQLWTKFTQLGTPFGNALKVLLQTGQRREEVGRMRWADLDLENNLWLLPRTVTKNKQPHQVPLLPDAKAIIKAQPRMGEYVFSSNGKAAISGWSKVTRKMRDDLSKQKIDIPDWRIHDLRRTVASNLGDLGFNDSVIGLLLNHQSRSVTAIYNRSNHMLQKTEMLEKWNARLKGIVEA